MKTTNLKYIAYALSALMLMQSCTVYHSKTSTVDEAVLSKNKVKLYSAENQEYKFDRLVMEGGKIYGIKNIHGSNKKVKSTIELAPYIKEVDLDKGLTKILLPFEIKEIHEKNKIMSIVVSLIPVWILLLRWAEAGEITLM